MVGEIGWARDRNLLHTAKPAHHHVAIRQLAGAHHAVDALSDEIDEPLALTEMDGKRGMPGEELGQRREQDGTRQVTDDVDAQQPGDRATGAAIRILQVGEDRHAAAIIGLPLDRRLDVTRRALEKPRTEPLLEVLDRSGGDWARDAEIGRRSAEAAAVDDADEEVEGAEPVHVIVP